MDAVAIVVRAVAPEVSGTVPSHGIPVAGSDAVHVVTVVYAHVIAVAIVETKISVGLFPVSGRLTSSGIAAKAATGNV